MLRYCASGKVVVDKIMRNYEVNVCGDYWLVKTEDVFDGVTTNEKYCWKTFSLSSNLLVQYNFSPKTRRPYAQLKPLSAPVTCPDAVSHFIWLTMTPFIKLNEQGYAEMPPVYDCSADLGTNPQLRHKCYIEYLQGSAPLPKTISFFNKGTYNRYANGTNITMPYPRPYDKGFLEARFEAFVITNWNGIQMPLKVSGKQLFSA